MSKQAFSIEGDFQMGRVRQHFTVNVAANDEDEARSHVYTDLGSRHGVKRREIAIQSIKAIDASDADPITRKRIGN